MAGDRNQGAGRGKALLTFTTPSYSLRWILRSISPIRHENPSFLGGEDDFGCATTDRIPQVMGDIEFLSVGFPEDCLV